MAECPAETPEGDALWQFSLAFYAVPGVAEALITLQDREGLDVNLILFALWLGLSGRGGLDRDRLAAADRAVRTIRTEIVEPLRSLRRTLRDYPDEDVRRLREDVKALELAGEKLAQVRLARLAGDARSDAPLEPRLADARENFELYLGPETATGTAAAVIQEAIATFASGTAPLRFPPLQAGEG
jgi:uncharacterized protein (TIGR02444 family)